MPKLIELVYEGGAVLDVALAEQRALLQSSVPHFISLDLRGRGTRARLAMFQRVRDHYDYVLVRGASKIDEVAKVFSKSKIFLDYLARYESIGPGSLMACAHRISRVFVYSEKAESDVRKAGVGKISPYSGPGLPSLEGIREKHDRPIVAVLELGDGALPVLSRLKKIRKAQSWDIDIATTRKMGGVLHFETAIGAAEAADLVIAPMDSPDHGGPHEAALLCLSLKRALCTSTTSAFHSLPTVIRGRYIEAKRYSPGTYAASYPVYSRSPEKFDSAFDEINLKPDALPNEILQRM